jgi:hypothetical protein
LNDERAVPSAARLLFDRSNGDASFAASARELPKISSSFLLTRSLPLWWSGYLPMLSM